MDTTVCGVSTHVRGRHVDVISGDSDNEGRKNNMIMRALDQVMYV